MKRTLLTVLALSACVAASSGERDARAGGPAVVAMPMCGWNGAACTTGFDTSYHYRVDRTAFAYMPEAGAPTRNQLVVFMHGCCEALTPTTHPDVGAHFQAVATAAGYHALSVDYDNYPDPQTGFSGHIHAVCGCDSECYSRMDDRLAFGAAAPGMAPIDPRESVVHRVTKMIEWMRDHHDASWGQFLSTNGAALSPDWSRVVIAGHSLGSNLSTYIARRVHVARVVMLAGEGDSLDFPQTSYNAAAGDPACKPETVPPRWVSDNHFGANTGTAWATPLTSFYGIRGLNDQTMVQPDLCNANPHDPLCRATLMDWDIMHLGSLHDTTPAQCNTAGYGNVDSFGAPWCHRHGLDMGTTCGGTHNGSVGGGCSGTFGPNATGDAKKLQDAWRYALTN